MSRADDKIIFISEAEGRAIKMISYTLGICPLLHTRGKKLSKGNRKE